MHRFDDVGARFGPWAALLLALYLGAALVLGDELSGLALWVRVPGTAILAALAAVATAWLIRPHPAP